MTSSLEAEWEYYGKGWKSKKIDGGSEKGKNEKVKDTKT